MTEEEKGAAEEKGQSADQKPNESSRKLGNPAGVVSSTRARRLSNVVVQNQDADDKDGAAPPSALTASSKDTRARRLSYITNDVSLFLIFTTTSY